MGDGIGGPVVRCLSGNTFELDVTHYRKDNKEQYSRIEKNFGKPITVAKENLSFVWFVAGVSISVIIAWIFAFYTPSLNKYKLKL